MDRGEPTEVVLGVLLRPGPLVLIARRPRGTVYAGYWEFPGGKLQPGETPDQALRREFLEELGLQIEPGQPLLDQPIEHHYPHGYVRLHVLCCSCPPEAEVRNLGVAEHRWATPAELADYAFPEANAPILARLNDPALLPGSTAGLGTT